MSFAKIAPSCSQKGGFKAMQKAQISRCVINAAESGKISIKVARKYCRCSFAPVFKKFNCSEFQKYDALSQEEKTKLFDLNKTTDSCMKKFVHSK